MKKSLSLIAFLIFCSSFLTLHAQSDGPMPAPSTGNTVYNIVQQMPRFKGNLNEYLQTHIKYPLRAKTAGASGKVFVSFVVEKDGSITNVKVLRGVANAPDLDAEAVRVVSGMPAWDPGMQNGNPVRVQYNLPINFQLQ